MAQMVLHILLEDFCKVGVMMDIMTELLDNLLQRDFLILLEGLQELLMFGVLVGELFIFLVLVKLDKIKVIMIIQE